jgi:2-phosphosulfolactate phosphatase
MGINMVPRVDLEFTAKEANKAVKRRDLIIVIDVLRSCSTIISLLAEGARSIIPAATLREANELRKQHPNYLLFGERKGRKPKGFDFGNSPLGFSAQDIQRKDIIITTTSGTLAITRCKSAEWVLLGSFLNAELVARKSWKIAQNHRLDISFVLSGDGGRFSLEDFVCAGAIAEKFQTEALSDKISAAVLGFKQMRDDLCENIFKTQHARHLVSMGFVKDVEFSCQLNSINIVPVYRNRKIVPLQQ